MIKYYFFFAIGSLLKAADIGIFTFVPNNGTNSRIIKVCLIIYQYNGSKSEEDSFVNHYLRVVNQSLKKILLKI